MNKSEKIVNIVLASVAVMVLGTIAYSYIDRHSARNPLQITVVKDKLEQEKGLSGLSRMDGNQAMLFEFPRTEKHCMWNADVNFPLVVMFLSEDKAMSGFAMMEAHDRNPVCNVSRYALEVSPEWFKLHFDQKQ